MGLAAVQRVMSGGTRVGADWQAAAFVLANESAFDLGVSSGVGESGQTGDIFEGIEI